MTQTRKYKNHTTRTKRVFNKIDYNNGDGMLTSVWGPSMWHFLHTMSFNYPVNPTYIEKKQYLDFMLSLQNILPCKYCRINLKTNYKQLPITMKTMENRETFSKYVYDLHELVNRMLHKKSNLSYNDVRERYEHFRARCTQDMPKIITLKKENGCTESLYGKKAKCIIKIVPHDEKGSTFQMDKKCIATLNKDHVQ